MDKGLQISKLIKVNINKRVTRNIDVDVELPAHIVGSL